MDTRRKITVELSLYEELRKIGKKQRISFAGVITLLLKVFKEVAPKQADMEKRITRLEQNVSFSPKRTKLPQRGK